MANKSKQHYLLIYGGLPTNACIRIRSRDKKSDHTIRSAISENPMLHTEGQAKKTDWRTHHQSLHYTQSRGKKSVSSNCTSRACEAVDGCWMTDHTNSITLTCVARLSSIPMSSRTAHNTHSFCTQNWHWVIWDEPCAPLNTLPSITSNYHSPLSLMLSSIITPPNDSREVLCFTFVLNSVGEAQSVEKHLQLSTAMVSEGAWLGHPRRPLLR